MDASTHKSWVRVGRPSLRRLARERTGPLQEPVWPSRCDLRIDVAIDSADGLFRFAGEALACDASKAAEDFTRRLRLRHARASTALGNGVALPHADSALAPFVQALFVRTTTPLDFGAADGVAVSSFFFLIVPRPASLAHSGLLSRLRAQLMRPDRAAALRSQAAPQAVARLWRELLGG